jgi:hypothetical protein
VVTKRIQKATAETPRKMRNAEKTFFGFVLSSYLILLGVSAVAFPHSLE